MTNAELESVKVLEFKHAAKYAVVLDKKEMILFDTLQETVRFVHKLGIAPDQIDAHVWKIALSHTSNEERCYIDGYVTALRNRHEVTK